MKIVRLTYKVLSVLFVAILFAQCGASEMGEEQAQDANSAKAEAVEYEDGASEPTAAEEEQTEYSKKEEETILMQKWKDKAEQQLESVEDLLVILKDSTLDDAFQSEIEKQLEMIYPNGDSVLTELKAQDLKFKKFKSLSVENGDTLSLSFKNKKESMKAYFVVKEEEKNFGTTSEFIERLIVVLIERE